MIESRRARIVATIGPATRSPQLLRALVEAGMDVARLNFSHGSHDDHAAAVEALRLIAADTGHPLALLQDLQGPKIRIGPLQEGSVRLNATDAVILTLTTAPGDAERISTPYRDLPSNVMAGDDILLSDGLIRLQVESVAGDDVHCRVLEGGVLRERAGMNLPSSGTTMPALTEKDLRDLAFGLELGVDYVALSFVRRAADVEDLVDRLRTAGSSVGVVAKLEKPQAIDDLEAILDAADAVMVARGDLGVELPPERVPFIQKEIIEAAARHRVPVITATQMLESMVEHPRPTRAEASDVANAIVDGTDAVMLSAETAVGAHPLSAVRMMSRIVTEAETHIADAIQRRRTRRSADEAASFSDATAAAATRAAAEVKARALVAFTESGFTARLLSKYRPQSQIYAFTPHEHVYRRLALLWGVQPRLAQFAQDEVEQMICACEAHLLRESAVVPGDALVFLAGTPVTGTTNLLRLHRVGQGSV
ncbi:MAG: pyruvate kinase [Candidatus Latescibacterota bacterium]|nr:pyruvate kinase [Candidatus Latescibacterota bacterium]